MNYLPSVRMMENYRDFYPVFSQLSNKVEFIIK